MRRSIVASAALLAGCVSSAPEGADTLMTCDAGAVTPGTDPHNCGTCGHDCLGGACVAGVCQPRVLYSGEGQAGVSEFGGLALDAQDLYWTDSSRGIVSVPLGGGTFNVLVPYPGPGTAPTGGIAVSGARVYWTDNVLNVVDASPTVGHMPAPMVLAPDQDGPVDVAGDGTNVYWGDDGNGRVMKTPAGGGSKTVLATDPTGAALWLAIDASDVYWTNARNVVSRVSKSGGQPQMVAQAADIVHSLAIGATGVYWTDGSGNVASAPLTGGQVVDIATDTTPLGSVAVNDGYVYWSTATADGQLWRVPIGGGEREMLGRACDSCGSGCVEGALPVVVDAQRIYWTTDTRLVSLAKPAD
jgi:hypothetical protein